MSVLPLLLSRTFNENYELAFRKETTGNWCPLSLACNAFGLTETSIQGSILHRTTIHCDSGFCFLLGTCFLDLLCRPERKSWPLLCRLFRLSEIPLVFVENVLLFCSNTVLQVNEDGNSPLHVAVSKPWETGMIRRIVEARHSAACLRKHQGRLPLQLALVTFNQHWNEDYLALVDPNPASVEALELDDAIYPYLMERIAARPNALLGLLKSKPTLVGRRLHV